MYLEIFLADFAVFRVFWEFRGISRKYLNVAGPRPREISEALSSWCLWLVYFQNFIPSTNFFVLINIFKPS